MHAFYQCVFSLEQELAFFGRTHLCEVFRKFSVNLKFADALKEIKGKNLLNGFMVHDPYR